MRDNAQLTLRQNLWKQESEKDHIKRFSQVAQRSGKPTRRGARRFQSATEFISVDPGFCTIENANDT